MNLPSWVYRAWYRAAVYAGFYCERCHHYYRDDSECPRHGR